MAKTKETDLPETQLATIEQEIAKLKNDIAERRQLLVELQNKANAATIADQYKLAELYEKQKQAQLSLKVQAAAGAVAEQVAAILLTKDDEAEGDADAGV